VTSSRPVGPSRRHPSNRETFVALDEGVANSDYEFDDRLATARPDSWVRPRQRSGGQCR
jgi:hypothetical protein